jgi:peptidoglycan/LPS O-acetylase OafA/YrhL
MKAATVSNIGFGWKENETYWSNFDIFGRLSPFCCFMRFCVHAGLYSISTGILPDKYYSHFLVIIFFVISGYVIAASADRPDQTQSNYTADRLTRLSSVVIPALALTYCFDAIGSKV